MRKGVIKCTSERLKLVSQRRGAIATNVDMRSDDSQQCPPGLVYNVTEGRRLCSKPSLASRCSSTMFITQGVEYRKVCGKVIGY